MFDQRTLARRLVAVSSKHATFNYEKAFSCNLGLVQPHEQAQLREKTIAIAGLGGVGGAHLLTLTRMGVGKFHIADFDQFEVHNMNRQAGAFTSTLGKDKADVMEAMTYDINPTALVRKFNEGITVANIDNFLDNVDVAIDALDYFALEARALFYRVAYEKKIPVVVAGPYGCSASLLVFMPGGMTWHDYFAIDLAEQESDRYLLFALGSAPRATQIGYLDLNYVNFAEKRGPSLSLAIELCAGVVAAEVMKLLLKRGPILAAPYFHQFDAYRYRYSVGKLRWGNRGPMQRLKLLLFRRMLHKKNLTRSLLQQV